MMMSSLRSENTVGGKVIFSEHKLTASVFFMTSIRITQVSILLNYVAHHTRTLNRVFILFRL